MERKEIYSFDELREIIAALRSEHGCPWDRKQTHESLRTCLLEETYEVWEGIRLLQETGNSENLREELGDVLLQVVMHSQIAEEQGAFNLDDVVTGISKKMIHRHPHVFGDASVKNSGEVRENWEELKKQEKKSPETPLQELQSVPKTFPALIRTVKLQKKVDRLFEKQPEKEESVRDAVELLRNLNEENAERSIGKMLIEICNLARIFGVSAEQVLMDESEKQYIKKYLDKR